MTDAMMAPIDGAQMRATTSHWTQYRQHQGLLPSRLFLWCCVQCRKGQSTRQDAARSHSDGTATVASTASRERTCAPFTQQPTTASALQDDWAYLKGWDGCKKALLWWIAWSGERCGGRMKELWGSREGEQEERAGRAKDQTKQTVTIRTLKIKMLYSRHLC